MWNIWVFEGLDVKDGKTKVRYESVSKHEEVSMEKRVVCFFSFPMPSANGTRTCLNYNTFSLHAREKIPNAQGRETFEDVTWRVPPPGVVSILKPYTNQATQIPVRD